MTEKQFLSTLNRKLWWDVPGAERKAAISSYQKYFAENNGRDEAELVAECGDIGLIADEILVEYGQTNHPVRRFLAVMVLWLVAGLLPFNYVRLTSNTPDYALLRFLACIFLPFVTAWIIGGKKLSFKHLPSKKGFLLFFLGGAVGLGVILAAIEFLVDMSVLVELSQAVDPSMINIWGNQEPRQFGIIWTAVLQISSLLVGVFASFTCLMAIRRNIYFLLALPFCGGVLLFILEHYTSLSSMDSSYEEFSVIYRLMMSFARSHVLTGLICVLFLALAIFLRRKVRKW